MHLATPAHPLKDDQLNESSQGLDPRLAEDFVTRSHLGRAIKLVVSCGVRSLFLTQRNLCIIQRSIRTDRLVIFVNHRRGLNTICAPTHGCCASYDLAQCHWIHYHLIACEGCSPLRFITVHLDGSGHHPQPRINYHTTERRWTVVIRRAGERSIAVGSDGWGI